MNTFKQSAIEILKKAKTPLHYTEITRLALESGILETEGATPEASMNAQITVEKEMGLATIYDIIKLKLKGRWGVIMLTTFKIKICLKMDGQQLTQ